MSFKDATVIIGRFNDAVDHTTTAMKAVQVGDREKEISHKYDAGSAIYEAYEWSLKYHLYKKNNKRSDIIINGKKIYFKKMTAPEWILAMQKIADPPLNDPSVDINIELLARLKYPVRDGKTHNAEEPDLASQKRALEEVRKIIMTYVDKSAKLKEVPNINNVTVSKWEDLYWHCNQFSVNDRSYALIIGPSQDIDQECLRLLGKLPWTVVFDFDQQSMNNGFYYACSLSGEPNPHIVTLNDSNNINISRYATKRHWFFANGIEGRSGTSFFNYGKWRQNYEKELDKFIGNFAQSYPEDITVVSIWDQEAFIEKVFERLETAFGDRMKPIIALRPPEKIADMLGSRLSANPVAVPISIAEIARGIIDYGLISDIRSEENAHILLPGKERSLVIVPRDRYISWEEDFDVLHYSIAELVQEKNQDRLDYFAGEEISVFGLDHHFDINRTKTSELKKALENCLSRGWGDRQSNIYYLIHKPGVGGTTISRRIAWDLHEDYPTLLLKNYREGYTADYIRQVYDLTKKTVLVVAEAYKIGVDNIKILAREVGSQTRPAVFLVVQRANMEDYDNRNARDPNHFLITHLNNRELNRFFPEYKAMIRDVVEEDKQNEREEKLDSLASELIYDTAKCTPFYIGLTAFENQFIGIKDYVEKFLNDLKTDFQKKILVYLSLCYYYVGKGLPSSFFIKMLNLGEMDNNNHKGTIFKLDKYMPSDIEALIVSKKENNKTFWEIRHHLLAEEINHQILQGNSTGNEDWRMNLADYAVEFIKDSTHSGKVQDKEVLDILASLFIRRANQEIKDQKFSQLIMDTGETNKEAWERIFKCLVEYYPDAPHFRAHLARYYSFKDRNRSLAMEHANAAVLLSEARGERDSNLYHIRGMCIREEAYEIMEKLKTDKNNGIALSPKDIEQVEQYVERAGREFEKSRNIKANEHGYIANIQMLIRTVDFGYQLFIGSREEYIAGIMNTWYGECLDHAESLIEKLKGIILDYEDNDYLTTCEGDLLDQYGNLSDVLNHWNNMLDRTMNPDLRRRCRRGIVRAHTKDNPFKSMDQSTIQRITDLMEANIQDKVDEGENIFLWFQAARFDRRVQLNKAIDNLQRWRQHNSSIYVLYYLYILKVCKAFEGYSDAREEAKKLIDECKTKALRLPNNTFPYEWYGTGKELGHLVSFKDIKEGAEDNLERLQGIVTEYTHGGQGKIEVNGFNVFFRPSQANDGSGGFSQDDVGKTVLLQLGFSYDGLRANSKSVRSLDYEPVKFYLKPNTNIKQNEIAATVDDITDTADQESIPDNTQSYSPLVAAEKYSELHRGDVVECIVSKIIPSRVFVRVDGIREGCSIYIGELKDGFIKDINSEVFEGERLRAKVIGHSEKGWDLSLKALRKK